MFCRSGAFAFVQEIPPLNPLYNEEILEQQRSEEHFVPAAPLIYRISDTFYIPLTIELYGINNCPL